MSGGQLGDIIGRDEVVCIPRTILYSTIYLVGFVLTWRALGSVPLLFLLSCGRLVSYSCFCVRDGTDSGCSWWICFLVSQLPATPGHPKRLYLLCVPRLTCRTCFFSYLALETVFTNSPPHPLSRSPVPCRPLVPFVRLCLPDILPIFLVNAPDLALQREFVPTAAAAAARALQFHGFAGER